jgi:hypothetical protein
MDHFFDQAARILASQIPRREALRRLGALFTGGILATLAVEAQAACSPSRASGQAMLWQYLAA